MKSAYELAMERLAKSEPAAKPVSAATKARLAEIDTLYKGKVAEREVFLKQQLNKALGCLAQRAAPVLARVERLGNRLVQPHLDELGRRRSEEGLEVDRLVVELVALMQQQNGRPGPHHLHMPTQSARLDETACGAVRPVAAVARPVELHAHDASVLTTSAIALACGNGSGT
jgi:hypothetical protein